MIDLVRDLALALREQVLPQLGSHAGRAHEEDSEAAGGDVTFAIDAAASHEDIEALVAQSQKRSAVYDIVTNPTNVTVEVS